MRRCGAPSLRSDFRVSRMLVEQTTIIGVASATRDVACYVSLRLTSSLIMKILEANGNARGHRQARKHLGAFRKKFQALAAGDFFRNVNRVSGLQDRAKHASSPPLS